MSWGYVAVGAATLISAAINSDSSSKASKKQSKMLTKGLNSQRQMLDKSLELQEPYREAGYESLSGLQSLTTPEGRGETLDAFYNGEEYETMLDETEQSMARRLNMTGGMRGGGGVKSMASLPSMLGQNFLAGQEQRFTGMANMGMGAASQGASGANNFGTQQNASYNNMGQIQAYNTLAQGQIANNTVGELGGLYGDWRNNQTSPARTNQTPPPEQQFSGWRP